MPKKIYTEEEARERKNARQREYQKRTNYASVNRYHRERGKTISFKAFMPQDNDIIEWMEKQENKAGYLKTLIRNDMKQEK